MPALSYHPVDLQTATEQRAVLTDKHGNDYKPDASTILGSNRHECPDCQKLYASTSLVHIDGYKPYDADFKYDRSVQQFYLYCEHCQALFEIWVKVSGTDTSVIGRIRITAQSRIDSFLRKYPEARGIVES